MGRAYHLLPWNPDAPVEPARLGVLEVGVTGGRVRVFVARPWGPEAHGGFLTPDAAQAVGERLIELAAAARAAEGGTP